MKKRRLLWLVVIAVVIAAAVVLYERCGGGWGLGPGSSSGEGSGAGSAGSGVRARCAVKVTAAGFVLDGKPATKDVAAVVTACKAAGGALVTVVGDAREGDWEQLQRALEAASVPIDRRGN
jgi:hypothetical protein